MSQQSPRRAGPNGPPAEQYGPAPGQTTNISGFHSTDTADTQETPRNPSPRGTEGYRGNGPLQSQIQGYGLQVGQLQANESEYQTQTAAFNQQQVSLGQQRTQVSSDVANLNQQVGLFNAQESSYLAGVATFNATFGGKQLSPQQYAVAQGQQKALSNQYASLFLEQNQLGAEQQKVGQEVNQYNIQASEANVQALNLNAQGASLSKQAGLLGIEAGGLNAEIANANNPKPVSKPTGFFGDIEIGAASLYGGFETGAKDVITTFGIAGVEVASLYNTGRLQSGQAAKGEYLFESAGPLPSGTVTEQVGAQILGYTTPGVPILKGIGESNASIYQRGFDVGVGILGVAPIGAGAAGLTEAGSAGAKVVGTLGNPFIRTGLGAGFSATGTAVSGGSPEQIGESALIGGGISYFGGELVENIGTRVSASAAAGRTAAGLQEAGIANIGTEQGADVIATQEQAEALGLQVGKPSLAFPGRSPYVGTSSNVAIGSEVENVYATTEQAQNLGLSSGPTLGQRFAMALTGGFEGRPLPVGGAETTTIENDTGIGTITETLVGAEPSDLQDYLQEFEGPKPTKSIPTGGEPQATGDQLAFKQSPFTTSIGKTPSTPFSYEPEASTARGNIGPSGRGSGGIPSGFSNPGRGGQSSFTVNTYPPGTVAPGFGRGNIAFDSTQTTASSSAFTNGFPEVSSLSTYETPPMGTGFSVTSQQSTSSLQKQASITGLSFETAQSQAQIQQPSSIQLVQQAQVQQQQQAQTSELEEGFTFSPLSFPYGPGETTGFPFPGLSLKTPVPQTRQSTSRKNSYAFGVNKNPVGNLLTLGTKRRDFDL